MFKKQESPDTAIAVYLGFTAGAKAICRVGQGERNVSNGPEAMIASISAFHLSQAVICNDCGYKFKAFSGLSASQTTPM